MRWSLAGSVLEYFAPQDKALHNKSCSKSGFRLNGLSVVISHGGLFRRSFIPPLEYDVIGKWQINPVITLLRRKQHKQAPN